MAKIFVLSKEAAQIRAEARASERAVCEDHYLSEQLKQRKQYAEDKEQLRKSHNKELKDQEARFVQHYEAEIQELHAELAKKNAQLQNSQDAWRLFKGVLPEISNYASVLQTKALAHANMRAKDLSAANELDQGLESIQRRMQSAAPDIEKLLSLNIVPPLLDKKGRNN